MGASLVLALAACSRKLKKEVKFYGDFNSEKVVYIEVTDKQPAAGSCRVRDAALACYQGHHARYTTGYVREQQVNTSPSFGPLFSFILFEVV